MTRITMKSHGIVGPLVIIVLTGSAIASSSKPVGQDGRLTDGFGLLASAAGAALDSNLMTGGGTDDTTALQRILDQAKDGRAVHLVIDGPALVSGLDVYGGTTIECTGGSGLYLKDDANRAIVRNAHRSRGEVTDKHITVRGCFFNGNRERQRIGTPLRRGGQYVPFEPDGKTFQSGLQFFGVHYLKLENLALWHTRSFGVWVANAKFVHLDDVTVDTGLPPYPNRAGLAEQQEYKTRGVNDDGVHFNGPIQYLTINNLQLRTVDDALALNANDMASDDMTINNDMGPYVGQGPITDVTISNVMFMDAHQGIRLLSRDQRIDRIVIRNLAGTVRQRVVMLSHFLNTNRVGNFGSIVFRDVAVDPVECPPYLDLYPGLKDMVSKNPAMWDIAEEAERPLFSLNSPIENLVLQQVTTKTIDERPLIRVGPDAEIQTLYVDINIHDPAAQAIPLKLVGRIERLNFSVDWKGSEIDRGKNPIAFFGGTIARLRWLDTPPMYVDAELTDFRTVTVTFSQVVKAVDFMKGVEIRSNGAHIPILGAAPVVGVNDRLHYRIVPPAKRGEEITWAYDSSHGFIQNLDGDHLHSVGAKVVRTSR